MFLDTDHSGLNKFDGMDDNNFALVLPEIRRIVDKGSLIVSARFSKMGTKTPELNINRLNIAD